MSVLSASLHHFMGVASKHRRAREIITGLAVFLAVTMEGNAADQSLVAPAGNMSAVLRAQFPYETKSSQPPGGSGQVDRKNFLEATTPAFPAIQARGTPSLHFEFPAKYPIIRLPEFDVNAQKYSNLEKRLDRIDRGIDREQLLSVPDKLDMVFNSGKILPRLISFGTDTAEKRAHDAYFRMQVMEMRRTVGLGLLSATPEARERLKADQKFLQELSGARLDEEFTSHPWIRE
jgi:hypothetical protein